MSSRSNMEIGVVPLGNMGVNSDLYPSGDQLLGLGVVSQYLWDFWRSAIKICMMSEYVDNLVPHGSRLANLMMPTANVN